MFFQTDHLSQNFKNISRNTKNVAQTKKTTYSIPVTCEKNQQINFVNNCTEQSRVLFFFIAQNVLTKITFTENFNALIMLTKLDMSHAIS